MPANRSEGDWLNMLNFLTKLNEYFLKLVGSLDADGSGGIDFFEKLAEPGMPVLAEKFGRFGWYAILALFVASIILVLILVNTRRFAIGIAAAILITVGIGYFAGHGVMMFALIVSVPLSLGIRKWEWD